MLIVQVCDFGTDGDAEYRLHAPSRHLGLIPGVAVVDCHFFHRSLPQLVETADVVVLQFVNDWDLLALCSRRRAAGKLTIFEANDYFFDLQPWSPIGAQWQDRTVQELYLQLLAAADGVQTSTEELARRWRLRGAQQVAVFPNQIVDIAELPPTNDRTLTIGWAGSPGHFADWYRMAPHISRWLSTRPEVNLAVMTHELAKSFVDLPPERYRFASFSSLANYLKFLRSIDIGLAPLEPTDYNRCRSDVKYLEYASQGVVGIYSDLEPYRESVISGETGLLAKSPAAMMECLEMLYQDSAMRCRIRRSAFETVRRDRLLADHIGERLAWYRSLSAERSRSTPSATPAVASLIPESTFGYRELRPEEPETVLLAAVSNTNKKEAVERLDALLKVVPNYLAAIQRRGQLLNDIHDNRRALETLAQARAVAPDNPRIENEIGRAWFGLGDPSQARVFVEAALRIEPRYLPAWQYLLRLLTLQPASDGVDRARRATELFPDCYSLAFLSAAVEPGVAALTSLRRAVDRLAEMLVPQERRNALALLRQSLVPLIKQLPFEPQLAALLRASCEVFPESPWLAGELGSALIRIGAVDEGYEFHSRAFDLRRQSQLDREEFPNMPDIAWSWNFADHLHRLTIRRDLTSER